jgi:hypothetical protein
MGSKKSIGDLVSLWGPALLMTIVIFAASAIPSHLIPSYTGWIDFLVKKTGHMVAYGLLASMILRGLGEEKIWKAWLLAVIYGISDEFHQSFVAGRNAAIYDVGFDGLGALIGLALFNLRKRF